MSTIIYIDDEVNTEKEQIKIEFLQENGFMVVPVREVGQVMGALQRHSQADLIILDILMPPHDTYSLEETNDGADTGLRLLADLRKNYPSIPIIIVSVKSPLEVYESKSKFKVEGYLYKPVLPIDILDEIQRVLRRKGVR